MYRKLLRIFVCLLLACSLLTVPACAESAVITGSKVNMRPGPGTDNYPIASLERNTVVDIVSRYNDAWYEVNYNGLLGYVSSAYLSTNTGSTGGLVVLEVPQGAASSPASAAGSLPAASAGGETGYINAMYVRFRSGPGSSYSVVGEYNKGKEIKIVTTVGEWVAGYIDGVPGYVHKDYVSKGSAAASGWPSASQSGSTASGSSGIVVLSPAPTAASSLPQPQGGIVVLAPTPTAVIAPSIVLPQPVSVPTPSPKPAAPNPAVNANGVKGYIVGTYVRFRTGPGTNYSIVGTYNTGKELTAYANCGNGWLFCVIDGKEGYVLGEYVYIVPGSGGSSPAQTAAAAQITQVTLPSSPQTVPTSGKTGYIVGNNVRFRAAPSMTSQILGELFYGNPVEITGTSGEWTQIIYNNAPVYVYSSYVKEGSYGAAQSSAAAQSVGGSSPDTAYGAVTASRATGQDVVNFASQFLGAGYCWGGASPDTGFDCSGFVYYVYQHFGITVSRVASDQARNGTHVDPGALRPGDILCFYSGSSYIGHSGIYIGGNQFIHSSNSTTGVIISDLTGYYASRGFEARRIIN